jgi:hypothetical protein
MATGIFDGRRLSLPDLRFAVEALHAIRVAGEIPLSPDLQLAGAPELFEHPEPVAVWTFLRGAEIGNEAFQNTDYGRLYSTDGWRLGTDPAAGELLAAVKDAGLKQVWFTVCGLEKTHDAVTGRRGAFSAIVTAMTRCRDAGLGTGASIILSKRNPGEVRELAQLMRSLGAQRFMQLYSLPGLGQGAVLDDSELELEDIVGLPPRDLDIDWAPKAFWDDPAAFTEGALTKAAIEASPPPSAESHARNLWLRVTADFDLLAPETIESGNAIHVGNLRDDAASDVYDRLAALPWPPDPPSDQELARRYGDPTGRTLLSKYGVRHRWLEAWRTSQGIQWLPKGCYE